MQRYFYNTTFITVRCVIMTYIDKNYFLINNLIYLHGFSRIRTLNIKFTIIYIISTCFINLTE